MRLRRVNRPESGAVAVIVALLVVVLFALGALAVDLGNAYTRVRAVQAEADFSALSVGDLLPAKTTAEQLAVADKVADYINTHSSVQDDRAGGRATWTGQALVDAGLVTFPDPSTVKVHSPQVQVDYGFASVLGMSSQQVGASATVRVSSLSGSYVMPLYAVSGCDYGQQVLKDKPNGKNKVPGYTPTLLLSGDIVDDVAVTSLSLTQVEVGSPAPQLTITGDMVSGKNKKTEPVDGVAFFRDTTAGGSDLMVPATPLTSLTTTSVKVQVPAKVMSIEDVWYVRLRVGSEWSPVDVADAFTVGEASTPTCPASSNDGNFGQLGLGDLHNPNDDIAQIMIKGPAHYLSAYDGPGVSDICTGDPLPAVHYPNDGTNCVRTESGFKPNAATSGLITGLGSEKGRLDRDTTARCGSSKLSTPLGSINNDYLSCFFTDSTTTIASIANPGYSGDPVLSAEILDSPRFFFVPVFAVEPGNGQSREYKIIAFRPAFLTEQPMTATRSDGPLAGNGLTYQGGKVASMNVVLFDEDALPDSISSGPSTAPFYSYGPKVVSLVD